MKKPPRRPGAFTLVVCCFCAVIWSGNLVLDLVYGCSSMTSFVLHIVCAVLWDIAAILSVAGVIRNKRKNQNS